MTGRYQGFVLLVGRAPTEHLKISARQPFPRAKAHCKRFEPSNLVTVVATNAEHPAPTPAARVQAKTEFKPPSALQDSASRRQGEYRGADDDKDDQDVGH